MSEPFTAEFFKGNRQKLVTLFTGTAPIVLAGNGLVQQSTDIAYPFKQDGSFWYLTGVNDPNIVLVMDKGKEYLIVPELSASRIAFDGDIDRDAICRLSGIDEIVSEKEGWKRLTTRLKRSQNVAVFSGGPTYVEQLGLYTNPARRRLIRQLKEHNQHLELLDLRHHMQKLRMVKQPVEIEAIQEAITVTCESLKVIKKGVDKQSYDYEFEIANQLTSEYRRRGASGHAFEPIVASGKTATTIHPMANAGSIDYSQPLLVDVGAEYNHYAADISRTWAKEPSKRLIAIHAAVEEVAALAMDKLKPGIVIRDYEKDIEHFMGEKLRELGLIKNIEKETVRQFYPHSTSHFLGLDTHDVGDYDAPLSEGVVLTVEPGIYVPIEGIGVRIENDVLITKTGAQNLSQNLPSTLG